MAGLDEWGRESSSPSIGISRSVKQGGSRMRWLLPYAAIALAIVSTPLAPAQARSMESGDAEIAQQATPAVVNISLWKVREAATPGGPPRRVKVYGSGFIIDPSGI